MNMIKDKEIILCELCCRLITSHEIHCSRLQTKYEGTDVEKVQQWITLRWNSMIIFFTLLFSLGKLLRYSSILPYFSIKVGSWWRWGSPPSPSFPGFKTGWWSPPNISWKKITIESRVLTHDSIARGWRGILHGRLK